MINLRKLFATVLAVVFVFGLSFNTLATPAPKRVEVSISAPVKAQSGENVTFTAVALKHGSAYKDEWIGATKVKTVLTKEGYYISTAQVTAQESATVQYNISMTAGNNVVFLGNASTSVDMDELISVIGAQLNDIKPVSGMPGFYSGEIYAILSDGTLVYNGSVFWGMAENQNSKKLDISVLVDDIKYDFIIEVSV